MVIYVVGAPTAGKSTLARIIKERFLQVNVVSFEAVRNGFIVSQPGLNMGDRKSVARSKILPRFMVEFAEWNARMTRSLTVVEGSFARVEQIWRLVKSDDLVICLGYGGRSLAEIAELAIRKADADSYLYGKTVKEFKEHFYDLAEEDVVNLQFCKENNVPYYDTADNRDEKMGEILELVAEHMHCLRLN